MGEAGRQRHGGRQASAWRVLAPPTPCQLQFLFLKVLCRGNWFRLLVEPLLFGETSMFKKISQVSELNLVPLFLWWLEVS